MADSDKFVIGDFTFDNFYEYRAAVEDVQKIECINNELDIRDPEIAIRLYNDMKDGVITFKSPIGQQFVDHVGDLVAQSSSGLLDVRDIVIEAQSKVKSQKVIGLVCVCAAVLVFGVFAVLEIKEIANTRRLAKMAKDGSVAAELAAQQAKLNEEMLAAKNVGIDLESISEAADSVDSEANVDGNSESSNDATISSDSEIKELVVLPEYQDLYNQNNDLVGWIYIMDTDVNYPVMQTVDDPEYYLRRDFYGNKDKAGTIFVDSRCNIVNPTSNTIIYGHNMTNGTMFGTLKNFLEEDFYLSHRTIIFNTIYEKRTYEIEAVGLSEVAYQDDADSYRYYNFVNASSEEEFEEFKNYVSEHSIFNKDVDISMDDKILTLSTCNSYTEDGRLFIVARCIN